MSASGTSSVTARGTDATISKPSSVLPARARPRASAATATLRTYAGGHSQRTAPSAISPASSSIFVDSAAR